jgi:LysR family transcriptional regulator, cyn operon transcriptional activator
LTDADSLGERARALKGGQTGLLRVGATTQLIESLLAVFLTHYRRRYPGVEVHLAEDGGASLPSRLERGEVHLAFTVVRDARFRDRVLFPVYCLAILAPSHPLARRATIEFSALADEPVLILRRSFRSREWFEAACRIADVRPRVLLESAAPHTLLALAQIGYGIAIVPSSVKVDVRGVRAVPLVQGGAPIGAWMIAAWHPRRYLPPYAEQFLEALAAQCRHNYPGRNVTRRAPPLPRPKEPAAAP